MPGPRHNERTQLVGTASSRYARRAGDCWLRSAHATAQPDRLSDPDPDQARSPVSRPAASGARFETCSTSPREAGDAAGLSVVPTVVTLAHIQCQIGRLNAMPAWKFGRNSVNLDRRRLPGQALSVAGPTS